MPSQRESLFQITMSLPPKPSAPLIELRDPKEFYRSAVDVSDNIFLKFNQFIAKDKIHHVFIFAEFVSTDEEIKKLKEVMFHSIKAFNTTLDSAKISEIIDQLTQEGIKPRTHIEFDYKNNFYRMEIDDLGAVSVSIRSNEVREAY